MELAALRSFAVGHLPAEPSEDAELARSGLLRVSASLGHGGPLGRSGPVATATCAMETSYVSTQTSIFNRKDGVCRGRAEIRELARTLMKRGAPWAGHGPLILRGDTVAVEWHASSLAEKFSVDIFEIRDGKVQSLRAYAGWRPIMALTGGTRD